MINKKMKMVNKRINKFKLKKLEEKKEYLKYLKDM